MQLRLSLIVFIIAAVTAPLLAQDFYEQQLRAGQADAAAGRVVPASDELRIAAFGFLDRPPLLTAALVQLALVQSSLGNTAAVARTLDRFLEVERRFSTYATAQIDDKTRTAFEALLLKSEPRSALAGISSLSRINRSDVDKVSDLPAEKRAAAYEEGFRKSARDIEWSLAAARDAVARGSDEDVIRWSRRALSIDNTNDAARALAAHAEARRGQCRDALRDLAAFDDAELQNRTELAGDRFVCLVTEARWSDAEAAATKLPAAVQQRTDVVRATQTLNARRTPPRLTPAGPATTTPRTTTAPASSRPVQDQASRPAPATVNAPATTTAPSAAARTTPAKSADALAAARALVQSGRYADASRALQTAIAADSSNRQLRMAMLEAALLSRDYPVAVAQVSYITPFADGEEVSMFYAAAALFEAGRKPDSIALMQRARPKLSQSPLVDYYSQAILAGSSLK